jgi:hypothetical protein
MTLPLDDVTARHAEQWMEVRARTPPREGGRRNANVVRQALLAAHSAFRSGNFPARRTDYHYGCIPTLPRPFA